MTTQVYNGVTYTVKYVDPDAVGSGTGDSEADALTALPATASLAATTMYIIRRTVTELTWTVGTATGADIIVMGCPKVNDMMASNVPAKKTPYSF